MKNVRNSAVIILTVLAFAISLQLKSQVPKVPGIIIDYIPASTKTYIGSPSICILPDGSYIASHDHFGRNSTEHTQALTAVFKSADKGKNWTKISEINGQFRSNLFVHNDLLYIMGTWKHHGNLIIRRSSDKGHTWSEPTNEKTGLIRAGEYHTAPMPMLIHNGRIWRAVEYAKSYTEEWGKRYSAMLISASSDADLLDAANWKTTNFLPYDSTYLNGKFNAWLEGNAIVTPEGKIVDILRVATSDNGNDMAAIVEISDDGMSAAFDPSKGFMSFTGGARKFSIRFDEKSGRYWTISNMITEEFRNLNASSVRNTLIIQSSADLKSWKVHQILLHHPDQKKHGFQYIDWQFDRKNIIYVSRTAYDDNSEGSANFHDANYMTFHRINNFRKLSTRSISKNPFPQQ